MEDCTLKNIQINGTDLTGFTPGQTAYTITLPQSADMPVLTAQTTTGVAQLKITQPTAANTTGKITVTAGNPFFKQNYTVNVIREGSGPLTGIEVKTPELAVEEGKEAKLEVVLTPADAADKALAYESSNPAVAAVDETGRITALDSGTAVITVASKADPTLKATCTVTVYVKGDLTGDGNVNISDVMAACKVLARKSADQQPTPDEVLRGDVNGDTYVTITDIMAICKILAERA